MEPQRSALNAWRSGSTAASGLTNMNCAREANALPSALCPSVRGANSRSAQRNVAARLRGVRSRPQ
eukprot:5122015-Lingulodinium_polyedra.AAC.1